MTADGGDSDVVGTSNVVGGNSVDSISAVVDGKLDVVVDDRGGDVDEGRTQLLPVISNATICSMSLYRSIQDNGKKSYSYLNYWQGEHVARMYIW